MRSKKSFISSHRTVPIHLFSFDYYPTVSFGLLQHIIVPTLQTVLLPIKYNQELQKTAAAKLKTENIFSGGYNYEQKHFFNNKSQKRRD